MTPQEMTIAVQESNCALCCWRILIGQTVIRVGYVRWAHAACVRTP
jgi:hypothetical protein